MSATLRPGAPRPGGATARRLALAVSAAGAMMVALDGTVLIVAQPDLQRDLGATTAQTQWTSTGYLLAVAALLVLAGRLGDRHGHARLLLLGTLGFAVTSAGIALAPDIGWVIALRALQGVFGALLQPATLALLREAYPADRIARAVAVRTSGIGLAAAAGPVLGGLLVDHLGWRAVFVLNIPAALLIAAGTLAVRMSGVRASTTRAPWVRAPRVAGGGAGADGPGTAPAGRLDLTGALLLAGTLAVLVHTLAEVPSYGWGSPRCLLGLAAVKALAVLLVVHERRTPDPIVPRAVLGSTPVTASMAILLCASGGLFGALFVTNYQLQDAAGLDPLAGALRVLPLTVVMVLGSPVAAAAVRRYGPRRTALTGVALVALGIAGLAGLGPDTGWTPTAVACAVLGAGFATVMVTATGTVVGEAPPAYAGVIGGLKQTAVNIGPTLGIAVAAGLTAPGGPPSPQLTLPVLAGLAALALFPAALLPGALRPARGQAGAGTGAEVGSGAAAGSVTSSRSAASTVPAPTPSGPQGSSSRRP
ncbi:MFS transporter [Kitasatospora sp. NPDC004240]